VVIRDRSIARTPPQRRLRRRFNRPAAKHDPIAALRQRARALLWLEILAQATAPAAFCLLAYFAAALFGLATPWLFAALLLLAAAALAYGVLKLRAPTAPSIDRRIEAASGLKHRPFAALDDEPEDKNPITLALWRAHQQRSLAALQNAKIGPPAPAAAARDPYALRALLTLLLLSGLMIAGPAKIPARLAGSFWLPSWRFAGPSVTAWLTPPDYTGQPPQILDPGETITALAGASLTVITNGPTTAPQISLAGAALASTTLSATSHRADARIEKSGALLVGPWWHRLGDWRINVTPPAAPLLTCKTLTLTGGNTLRLTWTVTDPYGLKNLTIALIPAGYPAALPQDFSLNPATGDAAATIDLTNAAVFLVPESLRLTATNQAGMTATAAWPAKITATGLSLTDPTAFALNFRRRQLALTPAAYQPQAAAMLSLADAPKSRISAAADVKLAALATALAIQDLSPRDAVSRLLPLIREIEAGPDYKPQQNLLAANQALTAALQRALAGQKLDAAALQKLIQAVQQALAQHLAALAPTPPAGQPPSPALDTSALARMAQKIAADEAAGRTQQAAQELQQLQKLLSQLANAKPMTAAQMAQAQAAAQAASALSQITQGEANLLNQTAQGAGTPAAQAALQKQLAAAAAALASANLHLPGLGDAGAAMQGAKGALSQQDIKSAEASENAAIAGLQQAAAALAAAQSGNFGVGQPQPGGDAGDSQNSVNGGPDDDSTPLDLSTAPNPARAIEQQIIQQDSAPNLPPPTHSYYNRLLQGGGAGQ
jgi:hypothetical protein